MDKSNQSDQAAAILQIVEAKLDRMAEGIESIQVSTAKLPLIEHRLEALEQKSDVMQLVVTESSKAIKGLEKRAGGLEKKTQIMDDRLEVIERDTKMTSLKVDTIYHQTKMLKLRSDKAEDAQREHVARINKLESKS